MLSCLPVTSFLERACNILEIAIAKGMHSGDIATSESLCM